MTDFIAKVGVDPAVGLSRDDAIARRSLHGPNRVTPPVNCPSWVCCLLPCLLRTPSMQAYQNALPKEVTVRRKQSNNKTRKLRMDATSLVYGDVVELHAGDIVGADVRVLEWANDCQVDQSSIAGESCDLEGGTVVWRKQASTECTNAHDPVLSENIFLMSSRVIQGSAVGVVIATGDNTVWGQLLAAHEWPVRTKKSTARPIEEVALMRN